MGVKEQLERYRERLGKLKRAEEMLQATSDLMVAAQVTSQEVDKVSGGVDFDRLQRLIVQLEENIAYWENMVALYACTHDEAVAIIDRVKDDVAWQVFNLKYLQSKTYREIAITTGKSVGHVHELHDKWIRMLDA